MVDQGRVGYAMLWRERLVFGNPDYRHIALTSDAVEHVHGPSTHGGQTDDAGQSVSHDGAAIQSEPDGPLAPVPWDEVRTFEVDAPTTRLRRPGSASMFAATALAATGFDWVPSAAALDVTLATDRSRWDLTCEGFVGRGYWAPQVWCLDALAGLLVSNPTVRSHLTDPEATLSIVADVARKGRNPAHVEKTLSARLM